jgi:AcrR family transcriptional regulator
MAPSNHRGRHHGQHHDPRVVRTRSAVLAAARRLLVEEGQDAVTALRISEATGIARTTIYRHWPDREELLRETLAMEGTDPHPELSGDTRTDLIALLNHMADRVSHRPGARMMAVVAERSNRRGRAAGTHRDLMRRRLEPLRRVLASAAGRGDIDPRLDIGDALARLAGPVFFSGVLLRRSVTPQFVTRLVDDFLRGAAPTP